MNPLDRLRDILPGFESYEGEGLDRVNRHLKNMLLDTSNRLSVLRLYAVSTPYLEMAVSILRRAAEEIDVSNVEVGEPEKLATIDLKIIELIGSMERLTRNLESTLGSPLGREYEELLYRHVIRIKELVGERRVILGSRS